MIIPWVESLTRYGWWLVSPPYVWIQVSFPRFVPLEIALAVGPTYDPEVRPPIGRMVYETLP